MNEKKLTSRDVYYLIRRPTRYEEADVNDKEMTRVAKYYHPDIKRRFNSDKEPHFSINTAFSCEYLDGISCELFRRNNRWIVSDYGNCAFTFGSLAIDDTSKNTVLKHFKAYVKKLTSDFNIKYNPRYQNYYIEFQNLVDLQKSFYDMINFEISYNSVLGFIA